jgi:D-alanyl-D-alanine carboxypeptidase
MTTPFMDRFCSVLCTAVFISTLCYCLCGNRVTEAVAASGESNRQKVQKAVDAIRSQLEAKLGKTVPSLNVLIQTTGETCFVSSVPAGGTPITKDTYFRFASNTKNFTATAILNMVEDGWVDYKAKIVDQIPGSDILYVPATPEWNIPFKDRITIEQLLQHSAGIFDVDNDPVPGFEGKTYTEYTMDKDPKHQFRAAEMVEQVATKRLSYFEPGTSYHYSNTGYAILGEIIARVYSTRSVKPRTYADYLNDYVTGNTSVAGNKIPVPLKISFPVLASDVRLPSPNAAGTIVLPDKIEKITDFNMSAQVADGNGFGTMADLNTFVRTLMKGLNVLSPQTVKLMQTDLSPGSKEYALGCVFKENLGYGHNGARIGNLSLMAHDPINNVSIVVYLPLWDFTRGMDSFKECFMGMYDAAYAAREALGLPGKPKK